MTWWYRKTWEDPKRFFDKFVKFCKKNNILCEWGHSEDEIKALIEEDVYTYRFEAIGFAWMKFVLTERERKDVIQWYVDHHEPIPARIFRFEDFINDLQQMIG